jgi:hypothetical protein
MSFGQEIKDAIAGFQAGHEMSQKRMNSAKDREMQQARIDASKPTALDIEAQQVDIDYKRRQMEEMGKTKPLTPEYAAFLNSQTERNNRTNQPEDFDAMMRDSGAWYNNPALRSTAPTPALPIDGEPADLPIAEPISTEGSLALELMPGDSSESPNARDAVTARDAVKIGADAYLDEVNGGGGAPVTSGVPVDGDPAAPPSDAGTDPNAGRPPPRGIMEALFRGIDPNNEMPEAERIMNSFAFLHDHYVKMGEGEKAADALKDLYSYMQYASNQYGALAKAAAESGDIDGAAKALEHYYAHIPDGVKLDTQRNEDGSYKFVFTDMGTGKVRDQGVATPQQIAAQAMKMQPSDFTRYIAGAAGQELPADMPGGEAQTPADMQKYEDMIAPKMDDLPRDTPRDKLAFNEIQGAATYLMMDNRLTANDAVNVAKTFFAINPEDPGDVPWKSATPKAKNGQDGMLIVFDNNQPVWVSKENFGRLNAGRAKLHHEQNQALIDTTNASGEKGFVERLTEAVNKPMMTADQRRAQQAAQKARDIEEQGRRDDSTKDFQSGVQKRPGMFRGAVGGDWNPDDYRENGR